jgi:hypothetical protein
MKIIGIRGPGLSPGLAATFAALGRALGVSFVESTSARVDASIVLSIDAAEIKDQLVGRPALVVVSAADCVPCGSSTTLTFFDRLELPQVLRGRSLSADDAADVRALPPHFRAARSIARKAGQPVWAVQGSGQDTCHYVSIAPPELAPGDALFAHFSGARLARLLPLVVFVQSVVAEPGWIMPPLQAAFMFDDPNLHWTSYGFVDYREVVRQATAHDYHVAFATIPLDAWWIHRGTRDLFTRHARRVSLLYHGNDHVSDELGRRPSRDAMDSLLAQAVARVSRLEHRTGLTVSGVMAPPHGACSEVALAAMATLGFEAACVSRGSLRHHNPDATWATSLGFRACEQVAGLPIVPRFALTAACRNDILVAALLGQPIVPMTHHHALAEGYQLLTTTADFINGLGDVRWADLRSLSRRLFMERRDGEVLEVRPLSNFVRLDVPPGITSVAVALAGPAPPSTPLMWRASATASWEPIPGGELPVRPGQRIDIAARGLVEARRAPCAGGRSRARPLARRVVTEMRDRALPLAYRLGLRRFARSA